MVISKWGPHPCPLMHATALLLCQSNTEKAEALLYEKLKKLKIYTMKYSSHIHS